MPYFDKKNVWLSPPDDIIDTDKSKLLKIIDDYSQRRDEYTKDPYMWHLHIEDEADEIINEIRQNYKIQYKDYWISISMAGSSFRGYDHHLSLSIRYEILEKLVNITVKKIRPPELLLFKKFLETPEGEELEAWAWWEEYWKNRVIPEE